MTIGDPQTQPLASMLLREGTTLEIWPDAIAVGGADTEPIRLVEIVWAGLVADPATLSSTAATAAPALALLLRDRRTYVYPPAYPQDAWRVLDALYGRRPGLRAVPPPAPGVLPTPIWGQPQRGPSGGASSVSPTQGTISANDTVLAGISHLSLFFAPFLLPYIVRRASPNKASYVAQQAEQALYFHMLVWLPTIVLLVAADVVSGSGTSTALLVVVALRVLLFMFALVFAILGAVRAFQGRAFHYPLLGNLD